jgi:hypothetical protein
MATTKTIDARKAFVDYTVYVPLGAAKVAADKAKDLSTRAWKLAKERRGSLSSTYDELADRGKKLATSVRNSTYTKRAVEQVKTARSQVKAAATSVRKATSATADATRDAAKKVS